MHLKRFFACSGAFLLLAFLASANATQSDEPIPRYKPSARSPQLVDIRTNAYGASRAAPNALQVGNKVPDFSAPMPGGGLFSLRATRQQGPVVLIFYRGHW